MIDSAILRAGRFDRCVHVPLPDEAGRWAILSLVSVRVSFRSRQQAEETRTRLHVVTYVSIRTAHNF